MYNVAVPTNKLQSRMQGLAHDAITPGTGVKHTALGVLLEVYDQERLSEITATSNLERELERTPGLLYGKVRLVNKRELVLPFKEPEDYIYLVYGNALQLEGRKVKIEYENMSIENGVIIVQRTFDTKQINIPVSTYAYDMGHII